MHRNSSSTSTSASSLDRLDAFINDRILDPTIDADGARAWWYRKVAIKRELAGVVPEGVEHAAGRLLADLGIDTQATESPRVD